MTPKLVFFAGINAKIQQSPGGTCIFFSKRSLKMSKKCQKMSLLSGDGVEIGERAVAVRFIQSKICDVIASPSYDVKTIFI